MTTALSEADRTAMAAEAEHVAVDEPTHTTVLATFGEGTRVRIEPSALTHGKDGRLLLVVRSNTMPVQTVMLDLTPTVARHLARAVEDATVVCEGCGQPRIRDDVDRCAAVGAYFCNSAGCHRSACQSGECFDDVSL